MATLIVVTFLMLFFSSFDLNTGSPLPNTQNNNGLVYRTEKKAVDIDFCLKKCGVDAGVECIGDKSKEENITCECKEKEQIFDATNKTCKAICNEERKCLNEGSCEMDGSVKTCSCPDGTEGPFCETISVCKEITCGKEAKCVHDSDFSNGRCECTDNKLTFDTKDKKCKTICNDERKCLNDGSCETDGSVKTCSCPTGTEGPFCETVSVCKKLICGKEATCVHDNDFTNERCECTDKKLTFDTKDKRCKSACDNFDCKNNGTCEIKGGKPVCACPDGYSGDKCEKSACVNFDCKNEGTCEIKEEKPVCLCRDGYSGDKCEKSKCVDFDCKNGGTCEIKEEKPVCLCRDGYSGDKCEKSKCDGFDCKNGGTCEIKGEKSICLCPDGYSGDKCEKINKCKEKCGLNSGENSRVICVGEPFGEGEVSCSCKDEAFIFILSEKNCRKKQKLTFLATFAISISVILGIALIILLIVYCRKQTKKPRFATRYSDRTVSFESALYDATNGSLSLFENSH